MTDAALKGQRIVLAICVCALTLSLIVAILVAAVQGPDEIGRLVVRFSLTAILCFFLYQGSPMARWIAVVLFGAGGALAIIPALVSFGRGSLLTLALGIVYAASALALLFLPPVRAHFARKALGSSASLPAGTTDVTR
jgi:hypothetical protein